MKRVLVLSCLLLGCEPFEAPAGADGGVVGDECADNRPCAAGACVSGLCVTDASPCSALQAADESLPSGVYGLSDGTTSTQIYCDMESFGGGYLLVGRSVPGGGGPFGWQAATGSLDDDSAPYSLGLTGPLASLPFTRVLFGLAGAGKAWGAQVYEHSVAPDFLVTYGDTVTEQSDPTTKSGDCDPPGEGPTMLFRMGLTELSDHFFFSDQQATPSFGFWPDGWNTNQDFATDQNLCTYTGAIGGLQGLIFVR